MVTIPKKSTATALLSAFELKADLKLSFTSAVRGSKENEQRSPFSISCITLSKITICSIIKRGNDPQYLINLLRL